MPRTIVCPKCGVVLNVPPEAQGRRLKCPKCVEKFYATDAERAPSTAPGVDEAGPASMSSLTMPLVAASARERETFELTMTPAGRLEAPGLELLAEGASASNRQAADAVALFQDDPP